MSENDMPRSLALELRTDYGSVTWAKDACELVGQLERELAAAQAENERLRDALGRQGIIAAQLLKRRIDAARQK